MTTLSSIRKIVSYLLAVIIVGTAASRSTVQVTAPTTHTTHFTKKIVSERMPRLYMAESAMLMRAGRWDSAAPILERTSNRSTTELDECLTIGDGSMPKLTLFRSRKTYRLQPRTNLQKDDPLVFAPLNANALVHVTGDMAPFVDAYDADHSPVFIVDALVKLAARRDVTVPLARLREELGKPRTTTAATASSGNTPVVDMTGELVFEPPTITIKAGQTVEWENSSREVHTVTAIPGRRQTRKTLDCPKAPSRLTLEPGPNLHTRVQNTWHLPLRMHPT